MLQEYREPRSDVYYWGVAKNVISTIDARDGLRTAEVEQAGLGQQCRPEAGVQAASPKRRIVAAFVADEKHRNLANVGSFGWLPKIA